MRGKEKAGGTEQGRQGHRNLMNVVEGLYAFMYGEGLMTTRPGRGGASGLLRDAGTINESLKVNHRPFAAKGQTNHNPS